MIFDAICRFFLPDSQIKIIHAFAHLRVDRMEKHLKVWSEQTYEDHTDEERSV